MQVEQSLLFSPPRARFLPLFLHTYSPAREPFRYEGISERSRRPPGRYRRRSGPVFLEGEGVEIEEVDGQKGEQPASERRNERRGKEDEGAIIEFALLSTPALPLRELRICSASPPASAPRRATGASRVTGAERPRARSNRPVKGDQSKPKKTGGSLFFRLACSSSSSSFLVEREGQVLIIVSTPARPSP